MARPVISVTKRNIVGGRKGDPGSCPIALAVRQKFNLRIGQVDVTTGIITITRSTQCQYNTPKRAAAFIRKFDNDGRKAVKPFKFTLPKAKNA